MFEVVGQVANLQRVVNVVNPLGACKQDRAKRRLTSSAQDPILPRVQAKLCA